MAVPLNLVVAGDGCVSKNCLLTTYYSGVFPTEWQPAVTYELEKDVMVDGKPVTLNLHYTNGMDDYSRLRVLAYPNTDVLLLGYSVVSPSTFTNIKHKWIPEVTSYMSNVPIILVGTKSDLRHSTKDVTAYVTREEAEHLAEELHLHSYREISALTGDGLDDCIDHAVC